MKKSHESKYKILLAIYLAAMLAVSLCACGGGGDEAGSTAASSGSASAEVAAEKPDKESVQKKKEAKKEESKKKEDKKEAEQKKSEQEKAEEARQESGEIQNSEAKSSEKSTGQKETKKESKPAKKKYCHIVIECKKLVGNDDIEPGYEDLVPSTGYILRGVDIEIKDGDTVYDVLKKAGKEYNFIINVEQTQFDAYIAGIAGLDEKICGEESGWKYKVNGSYPGKSCAKVKVSDGDKVVWVYVLKA